ncbi:MAG: SCP2 sterol-binding domain-containing protein [Saprospirales bacterium]|nr:SCP2 sterol-binding domain-containing protein [Saprospirales bacterium]MBK6904721.1 SCP2 sterol-binding domain-containing protein [Saprospirales bacterium]
MTAREFILHLPTRVKPEAIEGMESLFHFDIEGEEGGEFTVSILNGVCTAEEGLIGDPKCKVSSSAENFMDVITGKTNAMMAVLMGKVKITNQGEMMKYAKVFGLL